MPLLSSTGRNFEYEYTILVNLLLLLGLPLAAALLPLPRQPRAEPQKKTGHRRGVSPLFYLWPGVLAPVTLLLPGALAFGLRPAPALPGDFFFGLASTCCRALLSHTCWPSFFGAGDWAAAAVAAAFFFYCCFGFWPAASPCFGSGGFHKNAW